MVRVLALYHNSRSILTSYGCLLLSSCLETWLVIALSTLLVLEGVAKVVFFVESLVIQQGSLLWPCLFDRIHNDFDSADAVVPLTEDYTYTVCGSISYPPAFLYVPDW